MQNGASFYPTRLEDAKAVYLDRYPVKGDGVADDSDAIQQAIDAVPGQGILFIPEGRYRLTKTLTIWPGVRLIGYGAKRPTFVLADNTPGFQKDERMLVFFSGRRPRGGGATGQPAIPSGHNGEDFGIPTDANPGTFYSALSNVDMEIGTGNPSAVGVRGRYAQHCYLAHMDFRLHSGLAAIHDIGNEADDLRFFGGDYGIITRTPSPGWQFTLLDSSFEGQTKAAILTRTTGLTLVRPVFRQVPTAIEVDADHSEQLWMKDGRMEEISGPAIVISREKSLRTQINVENLACRAVPNLVRFRESGKKLAGQQGAYVVEQFSHGLTYPSLDKTPKVTTDLRMHSVDAMPAPVASDVPALPSTEWVNVRSLGAKGDGEADDTASLKKAIAEHRTLYFPTGHYRVTEPIVLRPDTVLIGLNPITTQLVLNDGTTGYGPGNPRPLLETPKGGMNIVTGLGLDTGGNNPAAVAALWKAGAKSMMDDVKFIGGHGSNAPIYNADHTADPNPDRHWDSQYPSLWVTDGGGGTFKNLWTASTFAQAGMLVSDTATEGRVYEMSSEHHVRHEIQVRNAANWSFVALQTEEERGEGPFALPLEIENSRDITIANLNMYRVVSVTQPYPTAVRVVNSHGIRFRGVHCYSNCKASFDNLLIADGVELRQREFASLTLDGPVAASKPDRRVTKVAGGFFNISGGAVGPKGEVYFVDAKWHRIMKWDGRSVTTVSDAPIAPVNLVCDRSGNLIVVSYNGKGTVYVVRPSGLELVTPGKAPAGATPVLPITDWIQDGDFVRGKPLVRPHHFVSPDGSVFLATGPEFVEGALTWGVKLMDTIRSFGFASATPGQPFYVTEESGMRTYAADVAADGTLSNARLFAEQGGEGVALGPDGNVYIAAGQVYVYSPAGKLIDTIRVPERPIQVLFSGRTLYVCARTGLYRVER